jgi:hypothetical protein
MMLAAVVVIVGLLENPKPDFDVPEPLRAFWRRIRWILSTASRKRAQRAARLEQLASDCDRQHAALAAGDLYGIYGRFTPWIDAASAEPSTTSSPRDYSPDQVDAVETAIRVLRGCVTS